MTSSSHRPTALRESWRSPDPTGPQGKRTRLGRRWISTLITTVLVGTFAYLLFSPFWHPTTRLLELSGNSYDPYFVPPLEFVGDDANAVKAPLSKSILIPGQKPLVASFTLQTPADVQRLLAELDSLPATPSDVILVYVAAHGIVRGGQAQLVCQNYSPAAAEQALVPLTTLLQRLRQSPAGVKLLILDHGRIDYDPRLGILVNEFPRKLREELKALRDDQGHADSTVWVLSPHAPLEHSHLDYVGRQSEFGGAVGRALQGKADINGDQLLTLAEMADYVRSEVSRRVVAATDGREEQTPQLIGPASAAAPAANSLRILSVPAQTPSLAAIESTATSFSPEAAAVAEKARRAKAEGEAKVASAEDSLAAARGKAGQAKEGTAGTSSGASSAASDSDASESAGGGDAQENETNGASVANKPPPFPDRSAPPTELLAYGWWHAASAETALRSAGTTSFAPSLVDAPSAWRSWKTRLLARERVERFPNGADRANLAIALRQDLALLFQPEQAAPRPLPDAAVKRLTDAPEWEGTGAGTVPLATFSLENARRRGSIPEPVAKLVEKLDQLANAPDDDSQAFQTWWRTKPWPKEADSLVDLRQWQRFATTPEVPWSLLRQAWQVARLGDSVASDPLSASTWASPRVAEADAWRRYGERELLARIGQDWPGRVTSALQEAARRYQSLAGELKTYRECAALRIDWLMKSPEYATWHHFAADDPELAIATDDIARFYDLLRQFSDEIEAEAPVRERLIDLRERLESFERRLNTPFTEQRIDAWLSRTDRPAERANRVELLLRSTMITPSVRSLLLNAAASSGPQTALLSSTGDPTNLTPADAQGAAASGEQEDKILNAASWRRAQGDLLIAYRLARLAILPATDDAQAGETLDNAWKTWFSDTGTPRRSTSQSDPMIDYWQAYQVFGEALAKFYEELPARISAGTRRHVDLTDASSRLQAMRSLEALRRAECLLDPRDADRLASPSPAELLRRATAYDSLTLQRRRCLAAIEDAPADERGEWLDAAMRCGTAAARIPLQPGLPPVPERLVAWDGPTSLQLTGEPTRELTLGLALRGKSSKRVWLMLDYDRESLEIRGPAGIAISTESEVRKSSPPGAEIYPTRPDQRELPAAFDLVPAAPQKITLTLKRRPSTTSFTRLIAKAICEGQVIRHEVLLTLPATDSLALVPIGPPESWSPQPDGVVLHPLPGHPFSYRFQMVNRGVTDRVISVEFLPARDSIPGDNAEEFLSLPVNDILARAKPGPPVARVARLALPAGGQPVDLPGPSPLPPSPPMNETAGADGKPSSPAPSGPDAKPSTEAPKSEPAGTNPAEKPATAPQGGSPSSPATEKMGFHPRVPSLEENRESANGGAADELTAAGVETGAKKPLGVDVRHGVLMIIRDLETGETAARRIQFRPQRPRRYLIAEAEYDATSERLSIRVRPRDPKLTPTRGHRVTAEFPESLPPGTEAQLEGIVNAPRNEAVLYAAIPQEANRIVTVHLHVDDYPRAFSWQIDCGRTATRISPQTDMLGVRVTNPAMGSAYRAPAESIVVQMEVDAPWGAFESARDFVEIGVDRERDRELLDDPAIKLFSDRQADIWLAGWSPDGEVAFASEVHDFKLQIPTTGLRNLQADVLAQARIGERTQWSEPIGVIFDAAPPIIENVNLVPDRVVAQMAELQVQVSASDEERSGVAKVEVSFDRENRGEFGMGAVLPATPSGSGRWTVKLPVDLPSPGPTRLLIRATDKVGNVSDYTKVPLTVVTKAEAEEMAKNQFNRVAGVVLFSKQPVANAKLEVRDDKGMVVATTTADDMGRFAFPRVKAGKYKLSIRGVSRNRSREKEQEITVPAPPAQGLRLEVQLSM